MKAYRHIRKGSLGLLAAGVIGALATLPAHASLLGDTITASGNGLGPASATIGTGVEFIGVGDYLRFDFAASTLTISDTWLVGWSAFGNYVFGGFDEAITGLTIASNTGFSGSVVNNFSFTPHSITLDMSDSHRLTDSVLVFNIHSAEIPEPASLALLGLALAGLGLSRRRADPTRR